MEPLRVDLTNSRGALVGDYGIQHNYFHPVQPIIWPHRMGVVPPLADCRQGREADRLLAAADGTVVTCQVVTGGGGVGKTQLAAALADRYWRERAVDLLVWVSATSRAGIVDAYIQAAREVTGVEQTDPTRFVNWLAATERRWLVIIDDLTDPVDLAGLWPPNIVHGRTVVTTRRRESALTAGRHVVEVGLFTRGEAAEYLQLKLGGDAMLLAEADELAADVGHLPLALAQAAAYMLDRRLSCADYRIRFADRRRSLAELVPERGALPDEQPNPVDATWSLSMELADQLRPAGLALPMLTLASLLDGNAAPVQLFTREIVLEYLDAACQSDRTERPLNADDARDTLANLHRLSLATLDDNSLRVHALVQRAVRERTPARWWRALTAVAAGALREIWPQVEPDQRFAQALRAHVAALDRHAGDLLWRVAAGPSLLIEAGASLGRAGQSAAAANYFARLLPVAVEHLSSEDPHTLLVRSGLARWHNDPAEAAAAFGVLLPDLIRVLGSDHRETLIARSNQARSLGEAGDWAATVAAYEELIPDLERALGPGHHDTLIARDNAITARGEIGDANAAVADYEHLLAERKQLLPGEESGVLVTRSNLAYWRARAGDPAGAMADFRVLIPKLSTFFGPDHPTTLAARARLILSTAQAGKTAELPAILRELIADTERVFGLDHHATLDRRLFLAHLLEQAGDLAGAVAVQVKLLPILTDKFGKTDPRTLTIRYRLAAYRAHVGLFDRAMTSLEKLIPELANALGPDHPDTLTARGDLARCRGAAGFVRAAAADYASVVLDFERVFGRTDQRTLRAWNGLGHWLGRSGEKVKALAVYERLIPGYVKVFGATDPETLLIRTNLACWQAECGDVANAVIALRHVLADQEQVLGPDHADATRTRDQLGLLLQQRA